MPRYIDADEIKLLQGFFEKVDNVPKFYEWLDKQPTIDAVEVVRCKDCKWRIGLRCYHKRSSVARRISKRKWLLLMGRKERR